MIAKSEWVLCPVCGGKTRDRLREDTVESVKFSVSMGKILL